ncbi:MAG: type II toxin-antitoxin system HicA family toxin [Deltaproteobacteria bacterium]|nr:type II toxin-antitoxin system HicA family toxin [Deltaproteobacteria bacterium]
MSKRFPVVTAKQIIRILEGVGFAFVRQTGSSHAVYKHPSDKK